MTVPEPLTAPARPRPSDPSPAAGVTVARSLPEVERLRESWAAAGPRNLDADPDHYVTYVAAAPAVTPHVVRLERAGHPPILVVARLVPETYRWRIAYRTVARWTAPTLVVAFDGVLGAGADDHELVVALLRDQLRLGAAAAVRFQKVDRASGLFAALERGGGPGRVVGPVTVRRSLEVPASWEAYLAARSSKSRRQLRYDDNRLERTFAGRLELRRWSPSQPDDGVLSDMALVARQTYQSGLGVSVADDGPTGELIDLARRRGWLRAWVLYVDGRPVSFWWGCVYGGTLSTGSPGYLPELARERVGYYTLRRMLQDACDDPRIREVDFGHGEADYKERFGNRVVECSDVTLVAARPAAVPLRVLLLLDALTTRVVARVGRTDLGRRLRRRLRRRLTASGGSGEAAETEAGT